VVAVREEKIVVFTDEDEAFIGLLVALGQSRKVATVLRYFSKTPETTSRAIERATDLSQPE
jgi:predicted transcriptional regulator